VATTTKFPTTNAIDAGSGFTNPGNANADDGVYATVLVSSGTGLQGERYGTFGFDAAIPAGATINSVTVEYQYKWSSSSATSVTARARVGGVVQTAHTDSGSPTADRTVTQSLTADRSWTRADLLDGTFEITVRPSSTPSTTFSIDYVKVTVDYTAGSPQTLSVGKVASPAVVRGVTLGPLTLGKVASPAALRGVVVTQTGGAQFLGIGKVPAPTSGASTVSFGDTTFEASQNTIGHAVIHSCGPYVAPASVTLTTISALLRITAGSEHYKLCVYNDSGGSPGSLVAESAEQLLTATVDPAVWQTIAISAPVVVGQSYWFAIICGRSGDGDNISIQYTSSPASGVSVKYNNAGTTPSDSSAPSSFPSPSSIGWQYSIYASYSTGAVDPIRGVQLSQPMVLSVGKIATGQALYGVTIGQAATPQDTWTVTSFEIALNAPTAAPTWTTIPATLLRKFETSYGRNFELDRFDTGTAVLTCDNSDRRFDPTYSSGPYYGNLKPLRRVRVRMSYAGSQLRAVIYGYIERINLGQQGPNYGEAELHLVDGFEVLANAVMETPIPTFTFVDSGSMRLDAVGPYRGSLSVQITDTHASDSEEFQATCDFSDDGVLTFNKRRSHSTGSWQSSLNTSDAVAALYANPRAAAVFKATVITPGWVGTAPTGAFTSGWPQELAHVRIGRALDGIGWPSADRALDTSSYQVQAIAFQDRNGVSAKQVADDAAAAELGLLYLAPDGRVTFKRYQSRTSDSNSLTTQVVVSDNPGTGEFAYSAIQFEYARDRIYNDILVEVASQASGGPDASGAPSVGKIVGGPGWIGFAPGGGTINTGFGPPVQQNPKLGSASDSASQSDYYRRTLQISTSTASSSLPGILAAELLRRYKDVHLRIASVTVSPSGQLDLFPHVLERKIGDRVLVEWTPPGAAQQITVPCWIEGVKHSVGPGQIWSTTWALSPVI